VRLTNGNKQSLDRAAGTVLACCWFVAALAIAITTIVVVIAPDRGSGQFGEFLFHVVMLVAGSCYVLWTLDRAVGHVRRTWLRQQRPVDMTETNY
jgi:hypothetical protein